MTGELLGHYQVEAQIGAGAMGVVYRAFDTRLQRVVAIKRLQNRSGELADEQLLNEARAAATLNHPNICTIHEVAQTGGQTFIVMEFVDGKALNELILARGLPIETVLDYGKEIADAVAYAHARGIVHRDLKSSNVVITPEGRPKVLDFGLALRVAPNHVDDISTDAPSATTAFAGVAGTPQYMSPEALRGESCTPRTDVWSLGVVLFEMAAGHRPFDDRTPIDVAARVLADAAVDVPPSVAPPLAAVIKRCLAKRPERRYSQAGEVRAALEAVQGSLGHLPASTRRSTTWWRRPAVAVAIVAATILVLAVAIQPLRNLLDGLVTEPAIAFAERDWLLISDFENRTGDPVFDRSLNTALAAAISQSRYVNIVPATRIRESLRRMERSNLAATDAAAAREIALREGFPLVLAPSITSSGSSYLLTASLIEPASGATVRSELANAVGKDQVLPAVDDLSNRIRRALGEADRTVAAQSKPLVNVTTASLEALQRFSRGREAHIAQQLDTARTLYEEALTIDPSFTAARASLGIINFEFFDRAKGAELLSQAVKAIDGLTDNERLTVQAFYAMAVERDLEKAAAHYKAFLALRPDAASAHNNLGRVYMQLRRFNDAIRELQETIRLDPDFFLAYSSLNSIYLYEVGDIDSAIRTAQRQLARNDRAARAYADLGAAYAANNDLRQAETALRRARDLNTDTRFLVDQYRLGHILRLQGRLGEARQVYVHIRQVAPHEISAEYEAGAVAQMMGDEVAARRHFRAVVAESERYLKKSPDDGERRLELAAAWARLGDVARARSTARQTSASLPVERAGLDVLFGDLDGAVATLARAAENGYHNIVWARIFTDLHRLQGYPAYEDVLRRMRTSTGP
jgi:tetratricopeptide (TPR) repeat protein/tRNA A-37 threonylcarbamoyl transferase component Bud32